MRIIAIERETDELAFVVSNVTGLYHLNDSSGMKLYKDINVKFPVEELKEYYRNGVLVYSKDMANENANLLLLTSNEKQLNDIMNKFIENKDLIVFTTNNFHSYLSSREVIPIWLLKRIG